MNETKANLTRRFKLVLAGSAIFFIAMLIPRTFDTQARLFFPCADDKPECGSVFQRTEYGYPLTYYTTDKHHNQNFRDFKDPLAALVNWLIAAGLALVVVYLAEFYRHQHSKSLS